MDDRAVKVIADRRAERAQGPLATDGRLGPCAEKIAAARAEPSAAGLGIVGRDDVASCHGR